MTVHEGTNASRGLSGYDDVRTRAAVHDRGPRGFVAVSGADAATFLHNVLTNDIAALAPGQAVYAAYLTPQGRMITDMTAMRRADGVLLDVEASARARTFERMDGSIFSEDVRLRDLSNEMASAAVHGPRAFDAVARVLGHPAIAALPVHAHLTSGQGEAETIVLRVDPLGVPGLHLFAQPDTLAAVRRELAEQGLPQLDHEAWEALRLEAGMPVFGIDMTEDTIPLEAGIQDRAISMTKGCYIGQEVIIRILHRGQGRVARKLVGLVVEGDNVPPRGAELAADGKEAGHVTSAAFSPRIGSVVALAYVSRALAEPGTRVLLAANAMPATVAALPL